MPTSSVPDVWTALHELVDGLNLTFTRGGTTHTPPVSFGPPLDEDSSFVAVGYGDGPAVNGDVEWAGLGTRSQTEDFSIDGTIFATSGDDDLGIRVTEVYGLLAAITEALATDYTLGGTCEVAMVRRHACTPVQDNSGSAATLSFVVAVTATT